MNDQRLEHGIREALDEGAPMQPPNHLLHTFEFNARRTRRYPRWLALIKEPTMRTDNSLAVGSPTARVAAILATTLLLAVAMATAGVAGQRLLASDGEIIVAQDGSGTYETITEAVAAADQVSGANLMYTLHFYSCTHEQSLRDKGNAALALGAPLFVTEWGASHADGGMDGVVCESEGQAWHDWMNANRIGWTAWKLDACDPDSTCILRDGAPVGGGWTDQWLRGHGPFVRDRMQE